MTTIVQLAPTPLAPAPARFAPAPVRAPLPLRFAPSPLRLAPAPVQARPAPQPIQAKSLYISHAMSYLYYPPFFNTGPLFDSLHFLGPMITKKSCKLNEWKRNFITHIFKLFIHELFQRYSDVK